MEFHGHWEGNIIYFNLENRFLLDYDETAKKLMFSFPDRGQQFITIKSYTMEDNTLRFKLFDLESFGNIYLYIYNKSNAYGVLYKANQLPATFHMTKTGTPNYGEELYEIKVSLNRLKKILINSKEINFLELEHIIYPSKDNIILKILNEKYKIESIAGKKSEINKIIRLLKWTNKIVKQGEITELPAFRDGLILLENAVKNKKTLNCKGLSILLTDIYASIGLRARTVWCRSSNLYDPESHFVTEVYSKDLGKWVMMDAAFGCFITKGDEILNIEEIRIGLINNEDLAICSNIGFASKVNAENYWYGIYKNFYRFVYFSSYEPDYNNECINIEKIHIDPVKKKV